MPTYDYECRKCGHRFEVFHGMSDETQRRCPKCRSKAQRVPSVGAGLLFKGSGFYITDYRSASYQEKARQEHAAPESAAAKGSDAAGNATTSGSPAANAGGTPDSAGPARPPATAASSKHRPKEGKNRRSKGDTRGSGS